MQASWARPSSPWPPNGSHGGGLASVGVRGSR
jgi:hypothetical protein